MAGTIIVDNISTGNQTVPVEALLKSGVRAWVNMDGQGNIRASSNVSSVTLLAQGRFKVSFITPMPHENYACTGFGSWANTSATAGLIAGISTHKSTQTTNSVEFYCVNSTTGTSNTVVNDVHFMVVV